MINVIKLMSMYLLYSKTIPVPWDFVSVHW